MFGLGVKTVTVDELARRMQDGSPALIDVREPHEFAGGHVPGAVNISLGQLPGVIGKLDSDKETYVICQSGHRSMRGARALKRGGFSAVASVKGGTSAWRGKLER